MDLEDHLKEELRRLHEEYRQRAQPILDQLAQLEALKPRRILIRYFQGPLPPNKEPGD